MLLLWLVRSFCLVVAVHVAVGLVVGRGVSQLRGSIVDAGGHQLVLEIRETEAGNFSCERQIRGGRKVVEREGAGHIDPGAGPPAAHSRVSRVRPVGKKSKLAAVLGLLR